MNNLSDHLLSINYDNLTITENGAGAFKSSLSACLDLFFLTVTGISDERLHALLEAAWKEDPVLTLKLIFQIRHVRGGKSDREIFFVAMKWLCKNHNTTFLESLQLVGDFGCWKDLLELLAIYIPNIQEVRKPQKRRRDWDSTKAQNKANKRRLGDNAIEENPELTPLIEKVVALFSEALKKDLESMKGSKTVSLAAKWAPTQSHSYDKLFNLNRRIALAMFPCTSEDETAQQKHAVWAKAKLQHEVLAPLRSYLKVAEVNLTNRVYSAIDYAKVPSVCMKRNSRHFGKNDEIRFKAYLEEVSKGKAKINSAALLPHEIVREVLSSSYGQLSNEVKIEIERSELQWKNYVQELQKTPGGGLGNALAVCDVSGSMSGIPMEVCLALGLLTSTISKGPFHNIVCTFTATPRLTKLPDSENTSLLDQIRALMDIDWGMNTDFEAVFSLILDTAIKHKLPNMELPKRILVFSDMQFDEAGTFSAGAHTGLKKKFEREGYTLPEIVYWNLRGDACAGSFPVTKDEKRGALLMSGYSGHLLKNLMSGKDMNMMDLLLESVSDPLYEKVKVLD